MQHSLDELSSWDIFFYYGQNDLDLEIESDAMMLALQPSRSLYYNAQESGGIDRFENFPNAWTFQINTKYNLTSAYAWKNQQVTDGTEGNPDRRIAVSQTSINITQDDNGNADIDIFYIPFYDFNKYQNINPPVMGLK